MSKLNTCDECNKPFNHEPNIIGNSEEPIIMCNTCYTINYTPFVPVLYNKIHNSYAIWNGSAWVDNSIPGAYFYSIEKANNNGWFEVIEEIYNSK